MANYIPFGIQTEILKKLPTKSLMQFRSVSKQWKSLIDSSKFISDYSIINHTQKQQHLLVSHRVSNNSEEKYVLFVDDDTFPHKKSSLPSPLPAPTRDSSFPIILGSSQGLFCLYSYERSSDRLGIVKSVIVKSVVVWNPSIRKSVGIDVPHRIEHITKLDIGLGVCPQTRDPKLVKIEYGYIVSDINTLMLTPLHFEVYSLSSRVWRNIPAVNQFRQSMILQSGQVVIDRFICWFAYVWTTTLISEKLIVLFDITNEKFVEVSLPKTLVCSQNSIYISNRKGSLAVVEVVKEAEQQLHCVWMMEPDVPNAFTKLYTIKKTETSPQASLLGYRKNNVPIFQLQRTDSDTDDLVVTEVNYKNHNHIAISWKGNNFYARFYTESLLLHDY